MQQNSYENVLEVKCVKRFLIYWIYWQEIVEFSLFCGRYLRGNVVKHFRYYPAFFVC